MRCVLSSYLAVAGCCLAFTAYSRVSDTTVRSYPAYGVDLVKRVSILGGYSGWRYHYGELGLALNQYGRAGLHPAAWACFVSTEVRIDNELLLAPKIGAWMGGGNAGMAIGANVLWYTDGRYSSIRLRPEIGIGFDRWKVVYGYNIPLHPSDLTGVNRSTISVAYLFGIKTLTITRE